MPDIAFPVSSSPGLRPQENAGRLINAYAEPLGEGARAPVVRRRVPGLTEVATSPYYRCRGLHAVGNTLLGAFTGHAVTINPTTGVITNHGTLAGNDRVIIAHNNASTPNIVAVCAADVYNLFADGSTPSSFADSDLPSSGINSVCFQSGYFFFSHQDGRIFASGLNAVTIDALDFVTAQTRPGGLLRVFPYNGQLFAAGPYAIDVYSNTGNASAFPYSYAETIDMGLAGTHAIAGYEDGWVNQILWVGHDDVVYKLQGYSPVPVSTPDVVRSIQSVTDKSTLEAIVYMNGPHAIWAISGGDAFTWEYNLTTGWWTERKSYGLDRWRAQASIRFGGQWLVGDRTSGKIFAVDQTSAREGTSPLIWEVWSTPGHAFPNPIAFPRVDFDFETGVGLASGSAPIETDPMVAISWADDGAATWGNPILRRLGGEGEFSTRISINRTGTSGPRGRQWRLVISDPRYAGLRGGTVDAMGRAA